MQHLFHAARYRAAADIYDSAVLQGERPGNDAILLRARIFLKIDSANVASFLERQQLESATAAQRARRFMYLGTAYARLDAFREADRAFASARSGFKDRTQTAELATHLSRRYLGQRDFLAAIEWYEKSRIDSSTAGKIRSEHLLSYILARQERFEEQAACITTVLDLIGDRPDLYIEDWYAAVHTLAVLAREMPLPLAARRAKQEVDREIDWSGDFAVSRFQALKGVAWSRALAGDDLGCLRYLRLAQQAAPGEVWRAMVFLDRSYFALVVGERQWAANEFAAAEELAEVVDWEATSGEERVALLLLAENAALHAPKRATYYIARFRHIGKLRSNLQHFAFDDRLAAMASFASGLVKVANGNADDGILELRSAWSTFDRISYDVRAARCAQNLYKATGKSRWLHLLEDKVESYPDSWLARELKAESFEQPAKVDPRLTTMQDAVMRLICEGLSTDAMANKLQRSRNTILNHLKIIYKKMGVNSREALVVEAMRRGLAR